MSPPAVVASIVIPAFNRVGPLRLTLRSARDAIRELGEPAEVVLVDDGSEPTLETVLADATEAAGCRIVRQANSGSIVARETGLRAACGEFVLFLDSDDLIAPAKLRAHVAALRAAGADISYDDVGGYERDDDLAPRETLRRLPVARSAADLLIRVQPLPHGPMFRRDYLLRALAAPVLPPLRRCDAVGDIWLFYNLSVHAARLAKVDAPLSLVGRHDEARYSQHWERLGYASLGIMETFMQRCPVTPATTEARRLVGERAFDSWRRLPRGFDPAFSRRQLAVWRVAPGHREMQLGGPFFRALARIFGPVGAGRLLRLRNASYARIRTIDDAELARLREI